jgi:hypothetical protein
MTVRQMLHHTTLRSRSVAVPEILPISDGAGVSSPAVPPRAAGTPRSLAAADGGPGTRRTTKDSSAPPLASVADADESQGASFRDDLQRIEVVTALARNLSNRGARGSSGASPLGASPRGGPTPTAGSLTGGLEAGGAGGGQQGAARSGLGSASGPVRDPAGGASGGVPDP